MSAAVATRQSQGPSNPTSRINSPLDTKRHFDEPKRNSPQVSNRDLAKNSPKTTSKPPPTRGAAAKAAAAAAAAETATKTTSSTANPAPAATASETSPQKTRDQSLPPPPPPPPPAVPDEGGDYFSQVPNKYREEPNPFEESFSKPDVLTPGKALLPPASQIASPNTNFGTGSGFNWGLHSLRSGPLSPAMLTGPSAHPYDGSLRTGLTPNESGIRSGLTPGGSGSMFPAPSPNSQSLFGFGSGPTPGTIEFQKTAMAAQAANRPTKAAALAAQPIVIAKPDEAPDVMDVTGIPVAAIAQPPQQRHPSDPFGVDANAAANGLYMLAQQGQKHQAENQFVPANIPQAIPVPQTANGAVPMNIDATGNAMKRNSIATSGHSRNASTATRGQSEASEDMGSDGADAGTAKGKKGKASATKKGAVNAGVTKPLAGNRRKAEDQKAGMSKKKKAASPEDEDEDMDDMDDEDGEDHKDANGDSKKMTDEEKRKNFLERNRVAALKCRQRKKQWLANLQAKVEYYGAENDALNAQVTNLREEILALKTLLLAHKDCPVSRTGPPMGGLDALGALSQGDYAQLHHGYPVAQVSMAPPGPRRFS